ncbi:MAG TPA: magnesium chelatase ATPase subunit I [Pyrinomonadaceae bacterium]|nr:magnesium chelatase ATPase subunit I [Pyrinomonadaceae bacterium]
MRTERPVYPFAAIVGQEEMKLGLLLNVIEPRIGGVLIMGHRGTGKSTAVRALADLLPPTWRVRGCLYGCDPQAEENLCEDCARRIERGEKLAKERSRVPVVDLPLGATEDRVCGAINIERALSGGVKAFEPGLLARANRGFLYIDEVNLLEDHLVDLLLDVAATGRNKVERESISVEHPSRFVLVGSGNPEEGELRPQLLDRFGLHVEIRTIEDLDERLLIVLRSQSFERDAAAFRAEWEAEQESLRRRIVRAQKLVGDVQLSKESLRRIAELCLRLRVDGHRGELTIARAARALAAFEGRREATEKDIERVAVMSLRHRLRRDPLDQTPGGARIEQALKELFPASDSEESSGRQSSRREPDDFQGRESRASDRESKVNGNGQHSGQIEQTPLPEPGALVYEPEALQANQGRHPAKQLSSRRQGLKTRASYNTSRGRYSRSTERKSDGSRLALDATLRAMIVDAKNASLSSTSLLRYKLYKRKTGALFIFAVDASGSMALNRIRQAKGALAQLLERSYVRRDHVALISFRGEGAEILMSPARSAARARRLLDELPIGGSTPLAHGLSASLELARRATAQGTRQIQLFLFTDGRANVTMRTQAPADKALRRELIRREIEALGLALKGAQVSVMVVDTQTGFTSSGEGRALSETLGAHYVTLPATGKARETDSFNHLL